jgi:hypothetical protein
MIDESDHPTGTPVEHWSESPRWEQTATFVTHDAPMAEWLRRTERHRDLFSDFSDG